MPDTAGLGDLWIRVSRLRECCDIMIDVVARPPGWRVQIKPQTASLAPVDATGDHLLETLAAAVNRAEAAGLSKWPDHSS